MLKSIAKIAVAGAMIMAMQTAPASAYPYHSAAWYRHHHVQHHARVCRNTGTAVGVVAGAVLGNALTHSTGGTVVGAGVGGVAGHSIAQSNCRRR